MTMSIVTRSGLSWRYFCTACAPDFGLPDHIESACVRMSLIIVRMKMASSQTRTVWDTANPPSVYSRYNQATGRPPAGGGCSRWRHPPAGLSVRPYDRREERVDVEQNEVLVVPDPHRPDQPGIDPRQIGAGGDGASGTSRKSRPARRHP